MGYISALTYCLLAVICAKTAEPIVTLLGLWTRVDPRNHVLGGALDSPTGSTQGTMY